VDCSWEQSVQIRMNHWKPGDRQNDNAASQGVDDMSSSRRDLHRFINVMVR